MSRTKNLVQRLPDGPLDVVGDVHGEVGALYDLLKHLGYGDFGEHPQGRKLVFLGDLCDRGPDSVQVIYLVKKMVEVGNAVSIVGNHELNLLRSDAKDGSGWFFDERLERDQRYQPFARPNEHQRIEIIDFLASLPLVLERDDLRIVHAAWQDSAIAKVRAAGGITASDLYEQAEDALNKSLQMDGTYQRYLDAVEENKKNFEHKDYPMRSLDAIAKYDEATQIGNPVKVLTSGVEQRAKDPFFSSHKWRFVERVGWWDSYEDSTPVIVGHYWRSVLQTDRSAVGKAGPDLFADIGPFDWHGKLKNVFCVDYSVGGRWAERRDNLPTGEVSRLAAMRWPERELVFDNGERVLSVGQ